MVTINKDGHVIISLDDLSYDLNVSKDYSDFLLKVTSPSSDVNLNEDCFTIEEGLDDDKSAKARRYAEFLIDFVQRREKLIIAGRLPRRSTLSCHTVPRRAASC